MNQSPATLTPVGTAPIEIGTRGYVLGAQFYRGLDHKRVKGKWRVRGTHKDHYSGEQLGHYTPAQWQSMTDEERQKPIHYF